MSSKEIVASAAGTAGILLLVLLQTTPAVATTMYGADQVEARTSNSQSQPRDPRPAARDLAAERAQFDKMMAALEQAAADNPTDAAAYQLIATHYWEKAYKDAALSPADKLTYIDAGITATDRALAQKPDYVEALVYKNLLLRLKANMETDPVRRQAWIAEADALRNQAMELNKARAGETRTIRRQQRARHLHRLPHRPTPTGCSRYVWAGPSRRRRKPMMFVRSTRRKPWTPERLAW